MELLGMLRDLAASSPRKRAGVEVDNLLNSSFCLHPITNVSNKERTQTQCTNKHSRDVDAFYKCFFNVNTSRWRRMSRSDWLLSSSIEAMPPQKLEKDQGLVQVYCATCVCASDTGGQSFNASLASVASISSGTSLRSCNYFLTRHWMFDYRTSLFRSLASLCSFPFFPFTSAHLKSLPPLPNFLISPASLSPCHPFFFFFVQECFQLLLELSKVKHVPGQYLSKLCVKLSAVSALAVPLRQTTRSSDAHWNSTACGSFFFHCCCAKLNNYTVHPVFFLWASVS